MVGDIKVMHQRRDHNPRLITVLRKDTIIGEWDCLGERAGKIILHNKRKPPITLIMREWQYCSVMSSEIM